MLGRRVKLDDVRVRNPEDGYLVGVALVAALVPLLKMTLLLKAGIADEVTASTAVDVLATGVLELGLSFTADVLAASVTADGLMTGVFELGFSLTADELAASSTVDGLAAGVFELGTSFTGVGFAGEGLTVCMVG